MFAKILGYQKRFMGLLGIKVGAASAASSLLSKDFMSAAVGLVCESAEVISDLNDRHRPWKPVIDTDPELGVRLVKEEMTDVMFYWLEMANLLGMTEEDIAVEYMKKLAINCARILEPLNTQDRTSASMRAYDMYHQNVKFIYTIGDAPAFAVLFLLNVGVVHISELSLLNGSPKAFVKEHVNERITKDTVIQAPIR